MTTLVYRFIFTDNEKIETEYITQAETPSIALHNIIEYHQLNLNDYADVVFDELRLIPKASFRDFDYQFQSDDFFGKRKHLSNYNKHRIEDNYGSVDIEIDGQFHKVKRKVLKELLRK